MGPRQARAAPGSTDRGRGLPSLPSAELGPRLRPAAWLSGVDWGPHHQPQEAKASHLAGTLLTLQLPSPHICEQTLTTGLFLERSISIYLSIHPSYYSQGPLTSTASAFSNQGRWPRPAPWATQLRHVAERRAQSQTSAGRRPAGSLRAQRRLSRPRPGGDSPAAPCSPFDCFHACVLCPDSPCPPSSPVTTPGDSTGRHTRGSRLVPLGGSGGRHPGRALTNSGWSKAKLGRGRGGLGLLCG